MIADGQALTDNANNPNKIRQSILEVAIDIYHVALIQKNQQFLFSHKSSNLQN
jgi:tryptophanyl-tRNA synthetase